MKTNLPVLLTMILCLALSACGGAAQPLIEQTPAEPEQERVLNEPPTAAPVETPQNSIGILSAQPYASPSGAFNVYFPQGWNCSESGLYRVDCQSPDGSAAISVRVVGTGYELSQTTFESLANAEIVYAYGEKKAYSEISRDSEEGILVIDATWREGETFWQSEDRFIKSGAVVYHIVFSAEQEAWEQYAGLFGQVSETAVFEPLAMSNEPIYGLTRKYTDYYHIFNIEIPTSWVKYPGTGITSNTRVERFESPDGHAAIQIALYKQDSLINQDLKAIKTQELMRMMFGKGYKVWDDSAIPDGRERLKWVLEGRDVSGVSWFDTYSNTLYIFSILWDDSFHYYYQPVLDRVAESFGYE